MSKSTINERMQTIVEVKFSGNKAAFAKAIGIAPTSITNYLGKKRASKPSADLLEKIVNSLDVNAYWLLTGEGDMDNSNENAGQSASEPARFRAMVQVDLTLEEIEKWGLKEKFQASLKMRLSASVWRRRFAAVCRQSHSRFPVPV